jgi:hypothetical protein
MNEMEKNILGKKHKVKVNPTKKSTTFLVPTFIFRKNFREGKFREFLFEEITKVKKKNNNYVRGFVKNNFLHYVKWLFLIFYVCDCV